MFSQQRNSFVLFMHRLVPVLAVLFAVFSFALLNLRHTPVAQAATSATVNFQARLQTASGGVVPDGNYNIEFKLYNAVSGGTALWTESYYNSNTQGLRTVNGYFSAKLGSLTAFPSTINWDQELWLTMNVGGTVTTGTFPGIGDGEMDPRLKLTATPYSFSAGQLQTTNGSNTSKLNIQSPTGGNQNFIIEDQGAAGTYSLLTGNQADVSYVQNQNGSAQTGTNFWIDGTGVADTLQASSFDRNSSGTLSIGNANATTLNIATNNANHTINIGTGTGTQTVTLGSTSGSSLTTIQGGNSGVLFTQGTTTAGGYTFQSNGYTTLTLDYYGRMNLRAVTDNIGAIFSVQDSNGSNLLHVDSNSDMTFIQGGGLQVNQSGITNDGALRFTNNMTAGYITPLGSTVQTKISIQNFNPGDYGQLIALGLPSGAPQTARVITLLDARTTAHQPTISVLSPDENQIGGFSWDGSNTDFRIKTSSNSLLLHNGGGDAISATYSSGNSTQTIGIGVASTTTGVAEFRNVSSGNTASIQAPSVGTSYVTNLPTSIGSAGQCLSVASVSGATQTLGYASCGGTNVQLQATSPGSQQTGHLNISGTGIFGTGVSTGSLNASGNTTISTTSTAAFTIQNASNVVLLAANTSTSTITLGSAASGNYITFTAGGGLVASGTARHAKSIVLAPEYVNAVFDSAGDSACASANSGTLTSAYDTTNYRNYYNWTTTSGTNQCYDVVVDVVLPSDFDGWSASDPINLQALASNTSNANYAIAIRNITQTAWDGNYGSGYASPGSISTSWSDVASSGFSGTYQAGDRVSIKIRMQAKSSANLRLSNLTLNYMSKW